MKSLEYDTGETGLRAVLKDYEEIALRTLWQSKQGLNSRTVWQQVNKQLTPETISRASIINYLEDMREMESSTESRKQVRVATTGFTRQLWMSPGSRNT